MKKTKLITILLIIAITLLVLTTSSSAALQANGGTSTTYKLNDWMINVRGMESLGGALGLTETINSDLTSSSGSNNLDIHMEKNTEYGAIAILSASSYGNPNVITNGSTTTGNETGIVMKLNKEIVAATVNNSLATNFKNANSRYKDTYDISGGTAVYVKRNGDALEETAGWHGSKKSNFLMYSNYGGVVYAILARAVADGIFSFDGTVGNGYSTDKTFPTRAIMICGEGI